MGISVTKMVEKNIHKYIDNGDYLVSVTSCGIRKTRRVPSLEDARIARDELKEELDELKMVKLQTIEEQEQKKRTTGSRGRAKLSTLTSWNLGYAVEKTIELCWKDTGGGRTAAINARQAARFFGERSKLDDIQVEHIDEYVDYLRNQGNSGATINRKLSALSKVLRTAYERGKVKRKVKMPRMREALHRIRFLTPEEEVKLISLMSEVGYQAQADAVKILLYTGFRCGELWRLECRDIDWNQKTFTLWQTKNGHPRTVPIVDCIYQLVKEKYDAAGGVGRLFPLATNDWLHNAWMRIRTLMGMDDDPQFVPHMLRHTCATRLAQRGVSMPIIKEWMGHTTIITTSRYTHFAPSDLQGAAALLSQKQE